MCDRAMEASVFVGLQSIPADQYVERGHDVTQVRLEAGPSTVSHFLAAPYRSGHGEGGFHNHPRVPFPATTQFHVGRDAFGPLKAGVG